MTPKLTATDAALQAFQRPVMIFGQLSGEAESGVCKDISKQQCPALLAALKFQQEINLLFTCHCIIPSLAHVAW